MSCMCLPRLQDLLASLKNLALAPLLDLLPEFNWSEMLTVGAGASTLSAFASMSAQLSAAIQLGLPPIPMPQLSMMANLQAAAAIHAATGLNLLSGSVSAQLGLTIGSINLRLAPLLPQLLALLAPFADLLNDLLAAANLVDFARVQLGINLLAPGAGLAFQAAAGLSLSASASANIGALTSFGHISAAISAAAALGINLFASGGLAKFHAALRLAATIPMPKINLSIPMLNELTSLLAALARIRAVFGINLLLPNALGLLKNLLAQLLPNLQIVAGISLTESLRVAASLSGAVPGLGLNMRATASLSANLFAGIGLPNLLDLAAVVGLTNHAAVFPEINIWSSGCCSGC